jgi:putative hydrolase
VSPEAHRAELAVAALRRIAFLLERSRADAYRVKAYRGAADALAELSPDDVAARAEQGILTAVPRVGPKTRDVVADVLAGRVPRTLAELEQDARRPLLDLSPEAAALVAALRGDCHVHSYASDGTASIEEMAVAARDEVGHEWIVLTDHSPRLTVANGLSPQRLRAQLDEIDDLNRRLAPFRVLTGIEVDILDDGSLDQDPELLGRLDLVVGSVHSKLRMPAPEMTRRMVAAIANPHLDVLGHCTGRLVEGSRGTRPESQFDAEIVVAACERFDKALEVNSRPERRDPPSRIIDIALEMGCLFAVDTDAHAPGQLTFQPYGAQRLAACGGEAESVVTAWPLSQLLEWTAAHGSSRRR